MQAIKFTTVDGSIIIANLDHFISLDHDVAVNTYNLFLTTSQFEIDEYSAAWVTQFLDVNDSFIPEAELPKIEDVPLTTRVAQALRYDFPNGTDFLHLQDHLFTTPEALRIALAALLDESVIVYLSRKGQYHHRNNYINPDAAKEILADPNIAPSEVDIASDIEIDKSIDW